MTPTFEFATAQRIVFGCGALAQAGQLAAGLGRRALVVIGASEAARRRAEPLLARLTEAGVEVVVRGVSHEPTVEDARAGSETARTAAADLVIACGGGSAIDLGKALAALITNPGDPLDYLEVIGAGRPLAKPPLPFIAIPTTAGTGAEVTRNAVLTSPEQHVKVSLRSPLMLPTVALVDPELTLDLPPALTAATGLDALTQLIEPFVCRRASPLTDAFCRDGLARAARALPRAWRDGGDLAARSDMALASLLGGLALANAGLGAVHGFAAPLGGEFEAPHGAVCATLLPRVMAANLAAAPALSERYDEVARLLTGRAGATADEGVAWVESLVAELAVPRLAHWGVRPERHPALVAKARAASSMKANPVELSDEALLGVLRDS